MMDARDCDDVGRSRTLEQSAKLLYAGDIGKKLVNKSPSMIVRVAGSYSVNMSFTCGTPGIR
jgi:hypothetical protein